MTETNDQQPAAAQPTPAQPAAPEVKLNIGATDAAKPEAVQPEVKQPEAKAGDPVAFDYPDIPDDPGLNMALKFVGKLGFDPEHPAMKAAISGDFSILEAHLATMGPKAQGYEQMIKLAKQSFDAEVKKTAEVQAATKEAIFGVVGGAEQWAEIAKWAGDNAEPAEKETINRMLNSGNAFEAKMAAEFLRSSYARSSGAVLEPQEAARSKPANSSSVASGALSPQEFQTALAQLVKTKGTANLDSTPEYKALVQRRQAFNG